VILYCTAGVRSAIAADILQRMGYANVAYLDGGFIAWKTAGQPVEDASAA
jgi:prepilin-type processing-associated H-X9-DG protein